MTHAKHTPGPWAAVQRGDDYEVGNGEWMEEGAFSEYQIATVWGGYDAKDANASLIAAAPDMEPIVSLLASMPIGPATADDVPLYGLDGVYITHGHVRAARAAIAKARGEA